MSGSGRAGTERISKEGPIPLDAGRDIQGGLLRENDADRAWKDRQGLVWGAVWVVGESRAF